MDKDENSIVIRDSQEPAAPDDPKAVSEKELLRRNSEMLLVEATHNERRLRVVGDALTQIEQVALNELAKLAKKAKNENVRLRAIENLTDWSRWTTDKDKTAGGKGAVGVQIQMNLDLSGKREPVVIDAKVNEG